MKNLCFSFIIIASFAALFSVANARRFNVGGNGVWVINPQESYKTWAERNRFQVNDTLYFKYAKGSDSVQQVMKGDFDGCNVKNPLRNFDNGESEVTLNRSGPFYFISGNQDHCKKGQKLIVVVLAVRNHTISPAKPPSTAQSPKSPSPVSPPSKSPSVSPISPAKPPKAVSPIAPNSPATSPSKSPSVSPISPAKPPKAASPISPNSPAVSPSHSPAKSPTIPSPSPKSSAPPSYPSPSNSPKSSPSPNHAPTSPAPEQTPHASPSPAESTPTNGNFTAPAPSPKNEASGVAVTSVMTTMFSVALTCLMFV